VALRFSVLFGPRHGATARNAARARKRGADPSPAEANPADDTAGKPTKIWAKYVAWQLEWENAIYRYRDGNNGKDNDDD
jgi:hypothetical protein